MKGAQEWRRELKALSTLADNWDGNDAPVPDPDSIAWAIEVTEWASAQPGIEIEVSPDVSGGVGVWLVRGEREASLGYLNGGDVTYVVSDGLNVVSQGTFDADARSVVLDLLNGEAATAEAEEAGTAPQAT